MSGEFPLVNERVMHTGVTAPAAVAETGGRLERHKRYIGLRRIGDVCQSGAVAGFALHVLKARGLRGAEAGERIDLAIPVVVHGVARFAIGLLAGVGLQRRPCASVLRLLPLASDLDVAGAAGGLFCGVVSVPDKARRHGGRLFKEGLVSVHDIFVGASAEHRERRERDETLNTETKFAKLHSNPPRSEHGR